MDNSVGGMIRYARKTSGLTLEEVARQVDLTPGALSHIENGKRLPDPKNAVRIAKALGIPQEDLMRALDEEHSLRRRRSASESQSDIVVGSQRMASPQYRSNARIPAVSPSRAAQFDVMYAIPPDDDVSAFASQRSPRNLARWSHDTPVRLEALEELAASASEAIRTLRGLVEDDDPVVAKEARRLLRELNVRQMEEER